MAPHCMFKIRMYCISPDSDTHVDDISCCSRIYTRGERCVSISLIFRFMIYFMKQGKNYWWQVADNITKPCTYYILLGHILVLGEFMWCIYPYSSVSLHWHWTNHMHQSPRSYPNDMLVWIGIDRFTLIFHIRVILLPPGAPLTNMA